MIDNPTKVKALIRNMAEGNSTKAQLLLRRYAMERFLERLSVSPYKSSFALKGGMLITSMISDPRRLTRDTDVTMMGIELSEENVLSIVRSIASIDLPDGTSFEAKGAGSIMEDSEYGGVRVEMTARLGKTCVPIKLDVSAGDIITPSAISYSYRLLLEERSIEVVAYNAETVLAEKIVSMVQLGAVNGRMKDYFDVWALGQTEYVDPDTLARALAATAAQRRCTMDPSQVLEVFDSVAGSEQLRSLWGRYGATNELATGLLWDSVVSASRNLALAALDVGSRHLDDARA